MQRKDYETAASAFRRALQLEPEHVEFRKELAYTLLKMGDTEAARDEFAQVVARDPKDWHSALEYGYLCHETGEVATARGVFHRVGQQGDPDSRRAAEQAFRNVDDPLGASIQRWTSVLAKAPDDFSAHLELAKAAEYRQEARLSAQHYMRAWQIKPSERGLLVQAARMMRAAGDDEGATAALLAASRGSNPRAADQARDLLPSRHPYAGEYRKALAIEPANIELRRELAFLWLAVNKPAEAEMEFQQLLRYAPDDPLALAQLGLMLLARDDVQGATKLLEKVIAGKDEALAAKVKKALDEKKFRPRTSVAPPGNVPHRIMGDRSYAAGYLKDAERYYQAARESDPQDPEILLKLGRTYNMLRQDDEAIRYFDIARRSTAPAVRQEAERSYRALRDGRSRIQTTTWILPMFSSRWQTAFTYGQMKSEWRLGRVPFLPYASLRFVGDSHRAAGALTPQYLSESSFILGLGIRTKLWRNAFAWAEAGNAIRYRNRQDIGRAVPDYRGGVSFSKGWGKGVGAATRGWFAETVLDAVTLSRFRWNLIAYSQNRVGYTLPPLGLLQWQAVWNGNFTTDRKREAWANFTDSGPGFRARMKWMPPSMMLSLDLLQGRYWIEKDNPRPALYRDVRAGVWYAFTR
ncbi:MAG: tetratricopeptide repeat protein [Bryobacterales bacterium]|nr:tetratricopeptide repeat protein [Bryobacterales bacterium]